MIWFATQVDRDFTNFSYGSNCPRFYVNQSFTLIKGVSYTDGVLTVKDKIGNLIELKNEPNLTEFKNTIYSDWQTFDETIGKYDEDRSDYEPWAYDSIKALACQLKLCDEKNVVMYYNKK